MGWCWWFRDDATEKKGITADELRVIAPTRPAAVHTPLPLGRLLRQPWVGWVMAMYFTYRWSDYFYQGWLFNFLRNGRGYGDADLLKFSWLPFVCGALANFLGGFASDALVARVGLKIDRRVIGVGGLMVSTLLIGAVFLTQDKVLTLVLLSLGYSASDFMLPPALAVSSDIGGKNVGAVSGAMNMAGQAGGFASSVCFGYIVSATDNYNDALLLLAGLTAVAAVLWLKINPE